MLLIRQKRLLCRWVVCDLLVPGRRGWLARGPALSYEWSVPTLIWVCPGATVKVLVIRVEAILLGRRVRNVSTLAQKGPWLVMLVVLLRVCLRIGFKTSTCGSW